MLIDQEVQKIIAQYTRAKEILTEYTDGHNRLANLLLEREVIYTEDVEAIFGKRPGSHVQMSSWQKTRIQIHIPLAHRGTHPILCPKASC